MKNVKIISSLVLFIALLLSFSSCGGANAEVLATYDKISEYIEQNGKGIENTETGEIAGYADIYDNVKNDDTATVDMTYGYNIESDGRKTFNVYYLSTTYFEYGGMKLNTKTTVLLTIDPKNNTAHLEYERSLGGVTEADIDIANYSSVDNSIANTVGITFTSESDSVNESAIEYCNSLIGMLRAYAGCFIEDCTYADLGFTNYTE